MTNSVLIDSLRGGLIVSCQALPDEPLFGAHHMAAMARAAMAGGAIAIRANSPVDIAAVRSAVSLPIIGLYKEDIPGFEVRITPTLDHARQTAQAGAEIIAFDATRRAHPGDLSVVSMVDYIHSQLRRRALADVSTLEEGLAAAEVGADLVATTLSGYTTSSPSQPDPDFALLELLVTQLKPLRVPVIAEGRISTPAQAVQALALGAHAVVVGSAITRPQWITARFSEALREARAV